MSIQAALPSYRFRGTFLTAAGVGSGGGKDPIYMSNWEQGYEKVAASLNERLKQLEAEIGFRNSAGALFCAGYSLELNRLVLQMNIRPPMEILPKNFSGRQPQYELIVMVPFKREKITAVSLFRFCDEFFIGWFKDVQQDISCFPSRLETGELAEALLAFLKSQSGINSAVLPDIQQLSRDVPYSLALPEGPDIVQKLIDPARSCAWLLGQNAVISGGRFRKDGVWQHLFSFSVNSDSAFSRLPKDILGADGPVDWQQAFAVPPGEFITELAGTVSGNLEMALFEMQIASVKKHPDDSSLKKLLSSLCNLCATQQEETVSLIPSLLEEIDEWECSPGLKNKWQKEMVELWMSVY